jgi:nucleotide-binding universal stress UspA family protein
VRNGLTAAILGDMDSIVMLCTDGSELALHALKQSLPLLAPADRTIVVTVSSPVDPALETGSGFMTGAWDAGGIQNIVTSGDEAAKKILDETVTALGLENAELMSIVGSPGPAIVDLAASLPASVVVIGTSGRGGFRRAMVGSTSDHIVRNAACPVLVQGAGHEDAPA